jgi:SAM-dependent methyltransferase
MNKTQILTEAGKILSKSDWPQDITVLDLGCGPALYWTEAYTHFKIKIITGVDSRSDQDMRFEEQNDSFIQTMTDSKGICDNCISDFKFVQSDILFFVERSRETYDLIVCFQILSLLSKSNAKALLGNFKKILKKPGLIGLCIPNKEFEIMDQLPSGIPDNFRNKFNLDHVEFFEFINGYNIITHRQNGQYHWALLSCT